MCSEKTTTAGGDQKPATELTKDEVAQVRGAGDIIAYDPFENEPRVPVTPIDPEIREDV